MRHNRPRAAWQILALLIAGVASASAQSAYPSWWSAYGVLSTNSPNDFGAANIGQAKNMAVAAVSELDTDLAQFGGAGPTLDALAATLLSGTAGPLNDYAGVNLGQLKNLAQPFYDRLLGLGYTLGPLSSGTYPWVASGLQPNDYAAANIGQLKYLFSFNVTASASGAYIPDWWIIKYLGNLNISGTALQNTPVPWSGGQLTYAQAYEDGFNPVDYFNGQTPTLTIVSGNSQTGAPGGFVSLPLVVALTDSNGNPLYDAPVTFTVTSGGGQVQASSIGTATNAITTLTNSSGRAQMFFQLPNIANNTSSITAASGTTSATGTFSEYSDGGGATYRSPFGPSNIVGYINADGSEDDTWQNNTDPNDTTPIPVWYWNPSTQTWFQIDSLPAGTTSYHIRPNPTPMP